MANEISKPNFNMPALPVDFAKQLAAGIAESRSSTIISGGGKPILRMGKDGVWVYGAGSDEVEKGAHIIVNIASIGHGWVCWANKLGVGGKNALLGEVMKSVSEPKPPRPQPVEGNAYVEQRTFDVKFMDTKAIGTECIYKTNSLGGMRAVDKLLGEIQRKLAAFNLLPPGSVPFVFPVLNLGSEWYKHDDYGRIYNPVLAVTGWSDPEGNIEGAQMSDLKSAPAPKEALKVVEPEPEAVKSTTQMHTGQRRRPGARS